ncbi:MAG: hypothetical protein GQ574_26740 [Crocinitomix sp.]|nr:hypothetical protein [Crocinitomix sp.]
METVQIINSLLLGITLYFVRDFHKDFKLMRKEVSDLKERFAELSAKVKIQIQSIRTRLGMKKEEEGEE